jgi:hypothetical protein
MCCVFESHLLAYKASTHFSEELFIKTTLVSDIQEGDEAVRAQAQNSE